MSTGTITYKYILLYNIFRCDLTYNDQWFMYYISHDKPLLYWYPEAIISYDKLWHQLHDNTTTHKYVSIIIKKNVNIQ